MIIQELEEGKDQELSSSKLTGCAGSAATSEEPHRDLGCVLKVEVHDDECKMKTMKLLSSITGVYSVIIDAEDGVAKIYGDIDPNLILKAVSKARRSHYAEVVWPKLRQPNANRRCHENKYDSCNSSGCGCKVCSLEDPHHGYTDCLSMRKPYCGCRYCSLEDPHDGYTECPWRRTTCYGCNYCSLEDPYQTHGHRRLPQFWRDIHHCEYYPITRMVPEFPPHRKAYYGCSLPRSRFPRFYS